MGKEIIILGERDGIQAPAIAECIMSAGAEPVLVQTQCFVWTSAGAVDLDGQQKIKEIFEKNGNENLVVILGAPGVDSVEIYGETVVNGDPTWAGPLAGIAMKIPVYHVLEQEIKAQIKPEIYTQHLAIMELALDVEEIAAVLQKIRETL